MTTIDTTRPVRPDGRASLTARLSRSRLLVSALALTVVFAAGGMSGSASASDHSGMPTPEAIADPTVQNMADEDAQDALYQLSRTTIRLRAGSYTFYRFNDRGALLRSSTIRFAWAVRYRSAANPVLIGNRWFTKVRSGRFMGWHLATPDASPANVTTFAQPLDVRLGSTTYVGRRFYANGRISTRRIATLSSAQTVQATKRATFGTRRFLLLSNGPLAGRWVRQASLTLQTPISVGGTTTTITTPTATSAAVTWKTLVLMYRETDVTFTRGDGSQYRLRASMSDNMYDLALNTVRRTVGTVSSWSGRMAALDMDVVNVPHPLTKVVPLGTGYWVSPGSVKPDLDQYAPTGRYDSIIVIFLPKDADGVVLPVPGWGLTVTPGPWSNGAGFSSVKTPLENWWWTGAPYPEEVFVHEWMHQVLFYHVTTGQTNVDLHGDAQYGYTKVDGTWKLWLSDVMQGRVRSGDRYLGMDARAWQSGTPTRP